ncbi:MAG: GAF domain-containing protein [Mariniphaga sp.]
MIATYINLLEETKSLITSGKSQSEILKAISVLLQNRVFHYDWVGFYILDEDQLLILGPYCGKPTQHTSIPVGQGVCGQVAKSMKLKVVQDVSQEENYIACSLDVQSEIVVPIIAGGIFRAEIDIDSHSPAPFKAHDEEFLLELCSQLSVLF